MVEANQPVLLGSQERIFTVDERVQSGTSYEEET
jgi:hypothetical protein